MRNTWAFWTVGLATVAVTAAAEATTPDARLLIMAIRGLALTGYQLIFWAILSSAYVPGLVRFFGRPFIKVHHILSITGLALVTLHPTLVAVESGSAGVFLPRFDSLAVFLRLGGGLPGTSSRLRWPPRSYGSASARVGDRFTS